MVGRPDPQWGEQVCAFVVVREPVEPDVLIAHCRAHLAGFKTPRHVELIDELPRNASGKVLKPQLRARLVDS